MKSKIHNAVHVRKSPIAGRGIFANRDFKKGDFVLEIRGEIVDKIYKTASDLKIGKTWISVGLHKWIIPESPVKYMNHSCDANLGFKTHTRLYARKGIKEDEELTIDYSTVEYVDFWKLPCSCGSSKCRGEMTSIQFLHKKVFYGYLPYIPRFFQKVYIDYNNVHGKKIK